MVWSHNDQWMVTGDTGGFVKYWQTNMNNVKLFQAHKDPVRGLRYPHLCHRPLFIITVTTTTTTNTTHFCCPPLLLWDIHHGCQRFYISRSSHLLSLVNSVIHSSTYGRVGQFSPSWTFFLIFVYHNGTSSTIITLYFTSESVEFSKTIETMYYIFFVCTHLQIIKEQLCLHLFILQYIYTFYLNICFLKIFSILTVISWNIISVLHTLITLSVFCDHTWYLK